MKRIGYVRTSTDRQFTDRQILALQPCCDQVYVEDGVSGRAKDRPVLNKIKTLLQPGDEFKVHAFDRAFRDVAEALSFLEFVKDKDIQFISLTQGFDPTTCYGRFLYILIVDVAEYEVNNLSERTRHGLQAAKERGSVLGRPKNGEIRSPKHPPKYKPQPLELPGVIYGVG